MEGQADPAQRGVRLIAGVLGVAVVLFAFTWALFLILFRELNVVLGVAGVAASLIAGVLLLLYAMADDREVARAGLLSGLVGIVLVCVQGLMG